MKLKLNTFRIKNPVFFSFNNDLVSLELTFDAIEHFWFLHHIPFNGISSVTAQLQTDISLSVTASAKASLFVEQIANKEQLIRSNSALQALSMSSI